MASKSHTIDAHFHIWDLKKFSYPWPTQDSPVLFKNFTLDDYSEEMKKTSVDYSVFVQVLNNSPEEAKWVMDQAKHYPFVKGVVAGLDLTDPKLGDVIDALSKDPLFVGCRHLWPFETDEWLLSDNVIRGLTLLQDRNIPFDLLLTPPRMKYIPLLAEKVPRLRMVVDHLAKPYIKDQKLTGWKEDLANIGKYPNIYCKISGLVVEADLMNWKPEDFVPYIKHTLDVFGPDRCMFGADWPVCKLANADFAQVFQLAQKLLDDLPEDDKIKIFGQNAIKFYNLKI